MKKLFTLLLLSTVFTMFSQVGINTTSPHASSMLDITSTDKGMLVPRMTLAQRTAIATPATSLLVYQTDAATGFWYYNGTAWVNLNNSSGEFKSIAGLVQNTTNTTADDFVFGSTSLADITGTNDDNRMLFNKSKGAFRAGQVTGAQWNDANVGNQSIALGSNTIASGFVSTAMGNGSVSSSAASTAMGYGTTASGTNSTAMGNNSVASGYVSIAMGHFATAPSYGETTLGTYATTYTPVAVTAFDANDRVFSVGNGISTARSNAMTLFKNGNFIVGSDNLNDITGSNDNNRLFFNKSKAAFRAGQVTGTQWDDANVGANSIALGYNVTASGPYSTAIGRVTLSSGTDSTAMSYSTTASGDHSTAMAYSTTASGWASTAMGIETTASGAGAVSMGQLSIASGNHAVALGTHNIAPSFGELVIGNYATNYTATEAAQVNPADRVFSVGNGTTAATRSNAMTILKDGKIGIGTDAPNASALLDLTSTNKGMLVPRMTAAQRTAIVAPATSLLVYQTDAASGFWYYNGTVWVNLNSSSGEFKSIAGLVQNTTNTTSDNFVFGSTSLADITGTNDDNRMFFNKSKGAFRAGRVISTQWDDTNVGTYSTALGYNTTAYGSYSTALGANATATGSYSTALGFSTTASGPYSTAIGLGTIASGDYSTALGSGSQATGSFSTALGSATTSSANYSTATGINSIASGDASIVMGYGNTSPSYAETVLGSYATTYTPVSATAFNAADRIFSVGNGTLTTRSNAMTILKNGRVGIGTDSPTRGLLEINGVGLGQGTLTVISHGNGAGTTALATLNGGTYGASTYSIWASGNIAATQFHAYSDARIKKILGLSDSANDLQTLEKIEITNYKMIDSLQQGNKSIKKVIAQQVEKVYPQAVANNLTEVIPNIYKASEIKNGWIDLVADVKVDDKVKLLFDGSEKLVTVTEVSAKGFKVDVEAEGPVFVYGKEVHDFRAVDYEALGMLNISATQELLKRIKELEADKTNLTTKVKTLEKNQASIDKRLELLEGFLLKSTASTIELTTNK